MGRKILYIHGFNGSAKSEKVSALKAKMPDDTIIAPQFSNDIKDVEANITLANTTARENWIDAVFGTSLGGFTALLVDSVDCVKVVHNPCLRPSIEMPKLTEVSPETIAVLERLEKKLPLLGDSTQTWGLFAKHDELFSYKALFDQFYRHEGKWIEGTHYLTVQEMETEVLPLLDKALKDYAACEIGIYFNTV
jgi:predicted esterase YcpF (UPF0227 family)